MGRKGPDEVSDGAVPPGFTLRRDLRCPKCGRAAVEAPAERLTGQGERVFRFSCRNYWGGTPKCWTCAAPAEHFIPAGEQLPLF